MKLVKQIIIESNQKDVHEYVFQNAPIELYVLI